MLLSPSLSPLPPQDSPSTTSPPLPEVQPPVAPPVLSPPSPSPDVLPPLFPPPLAPTPGVVDAATPPSFLPEVSPPAPAIAAAPLPPPPPAVVASPQPPPPPPPDGATTISPVALSPQPQPQPPPPPPALVLSPPPLPPISSPPPQPSIPLPSTSPPTVILPPQPTTAPSLPPPTVILPPQPTTAPSLPPPTPPTTTDPPPFTLLSPPPSPPVVFPNAPRSFESKPPQLPAPPPPPPTTTTLPLAVGKGGLPETKHGSHSPAGLIVSCVGVGIILFALLTLVCICCKLKRKHKPLKSNEKQQCLMTKDDFYAAPTQHEEKQEGKVGRPTPEVHVITVPALLSPLPQANGEGSASASASASASGSRNSGQDSELSSSSSSGIFSYEELVVATDGFSESNLLGQGGFGYVHKGVLPSGQEVAVKKLKAGSLQGEREFQAEVETVSRVHHKHLVSLVGYCITGPHRLLVYEFVPNNTLEFHLHGDGQPVMLWESRLKIAIGSAKGIAYLHEDCNPTIVHRDIKAANILLDSRFEAKVSDFGLAKTFPDGNFSITHVSTRVVGTFGYLAPEYALTGKLTDKSDVYSYGVMLLELITGSPPIIKKDSCLNQSLVDLARPLLARAVEEDDFGALVDPRLHGAYNKSEMARMVACASACIRQSAWLRPRMSQVFRVLAGDISLSYLNEGARSLNSSMYSSSETSIQNGEKRKNLSSKSWGISGCSRTTSEYGLHPSASSSESQSIIEEQSQRETSKNEFSEI